MGVDDKRKDVLQKVSQPILEKLNIRLPYDPATSFLGMCQKELKTGTQINTCIYMLMAIIFTSAKGGNKPNVH